MKNIFNNKEKGSDWHHTLILCECAAVMESGNDEEEEEEQLSNHLQHIYKLNE